MVRGRRGQHREVLAHIRKAGFVRARIDENVYEVDQFPELEPRKVHHIDAIVDRVIMREGIRARVAESINLALRHGDGVMSICYLDESAADDEHPHGIWRDKLFSTLYACPNCDVSYEELEPRTFSFNSPYGVCSECEGFGAKEQFDPELVIPDPALPLEEGVIAWRGLTDAAIKKRKAEFKSLEKLKGFSWKTPFSDLRSGVADKLIHGDGKQLHGLLTQLEKEFATTSSSARQDALAALRGDVLCPACAGSRLRPEATSVLFQGKAIHEITQLTVAGARTFFRDNPVTDENEDIAGPLVEEIQKRPRVPREGWRRVPHLGSTGRHAQWR